MKLLKTIISRLRSVLHPVPPEVFYIGGSDVLPPPLSAEEEERAVAAMEAGDGEAKQLLTEHNLRLVVYIARRFENTGVNLEDLISIGTIGLIKGINTYKPDNRHQINEIYSQSHLR